MEHKPKLVVIVGQTSTGKSDFAVQIAKEINGEIISADSRQVYRGLDIGSGKITRKEMRGVPHHILDVASPKKVFTVSSYKKLADKKINEIIRRKAVPIICGGTGFYIDAVVRDIVLPAVEPDIVLRATLAKKSPQQLFTMLQKLDPLRAETIDQKNSVRLVRAIEIARALGSVPSILESPTSEKYTILKIGLCLPDDVLQENIHTRLLARIKKGMLGEVEALHNEGLSWKRLEMLGLEYRYCALQLQGKITKQEMIEKLNTEIWHYAKRQMTWFKRDKTILWIDPRQIHEKAKALKKIKDFLK